MLRFSDVGLLQGREAQMSSFPMAIFLKALQTGVQDLLAHRLWPTFLVAFFCVLLKPLVRVFVRFSPNLTTFAIFPPSMCTHLSKMFHRGCPTNHWTRRILLWTNLWLCPMILFAITVRAKLFCFGIKYCS